MPLYTYENKYADRHCVYCLGGFDVMQKLKDPVFTECSYCGNPIKKIITAVKVKGKITSSAQTTMSEQNIEKNGFSQYRKVGKGQYEKTAGKGPETFSSEE